MTQADNIKNIFKNANLKTNPKADEMVLNNIMQALEESQKSTTIIKPNIWRIIMNKPFTKLAAAAVVIIAAIVGISHFGGSIDGASTAWADVVKKVGQIQTFIYRTRQTQTSGPQKEGFEFVSEEEGISYNSSEYGTKNESFINGELKTRSWMLRKGMEFIGICPAAKIYDRHPLTEANLKEMDQMNPRQMVGRFISSKWKELGYNTINGIKVKGIEADDPNVLRDPPPPIEKFTARLWVDIETELPVWLEVQFIQPGSTLTTRIVIDRFQWNVALVAKDFEPNIPADCERYIPTVAIQAPPPPPVDVNAPKLDIPNIEGLTLLEVNSNAPKPTLTLVGHNQIWKAQDEIMASWPPYSEVKEKLRQELWQKLGVEKLSNEQLVAVAVALREKFWQLGGDLSKVSYPYCYASRLLLESAHNANPDNMIITDELVETIQSAELISVFKTNSDELVRNISLQNTLIELRSPQFEQIKTQIENGRIPAWEDFVRVNDLAILLGFAGDYESAGKAAEWLISQADRGGWTFYLQSLKLMQSNFTDGKRFNYLFSRATKCEFPEEFRYSRRLSAFKGPKSRGAIPIHLLQENP